MNRKPQKFTKKPIQIKAIQFGNGNGPNTSKECIEFTEGKAKFKDIGDDDWVLIIPTLEGDITARDGDWIIKGIQGEFYPCKPDIFKKTYEAVVHQCTNCSYVGTENDGITCPKCNTKMLVSYKH